MKISDLSLKHQDLLSSHLYTLNLDLSEYCFPNLFLFRKTHDYQVMESKYGFFISGQTYDKKRYIMPTENLLSCGDDYLRELIRLSEEFDMIFPIPEIWLSLFSEDQFQALNLDGDTDYIYTVEKLSTYKGRHLHKKRNLLKQFNEQYSGNFERYTSEKFEVVKDLLDSWQSDMSLEKHETDYFPCLEALELFDELNLCGGLFYADDQPVGFILGEMISKKMFGLHFAKANKQIKGVYQYMFNICAKILNDECQWINLEQDMGNQGLRVAKTSYKPDHLGKKYRLIRN